MHDLKNKIKKVQSTVDRHIDEHLKDPAFLWDYDPPLDINESHKGRDVGKALKRLLSMLLFPSLYIWYILIRCFRFM